MPLNYGPVVVGLEPPLSVCTTWPSSHSALPGCLGSPPLSFKYLGNFLFKIQLLRYEYPNLVEKSPGLKLFLLPLYLNLIALVNLLFDFQRKVIKSFFMEHPSIGYSFDSKILLKRFFPISQNVVFYR